MNSKTRAVSLLVAISLICGCKNKDDQKESGSETSPQSTWDHESDVIKLRYLDQPAEILESWWLDASATTIEMEAPPMEFHLESHDGLLQKTSVDSAADQLKYQITVVHEFSDQSLGVQVRVVATSPEPVAGGTLKKRIRLSGESHFESDSYGSSPGFPGATTLNDQFTHLWGASTIENDKYIRVKVRPVK